MKILLFVALVLWLGTALAQAQQPAPAVQVLQVELMQQLNGKLQCLEQATTIAAKLAKAEAEIEELKKAKPDAK